MTLRLDGYDASAKRGSGLITDVENGGIALIDPIGNVAAFWHFSRLMSHWNYKHQRCAYVRSMNRKEPRNQYKFGDSIDLGIDTRFGLFLNAVNAGAVYLDPASKVEGNSLSIPKRKARNQFRINSQQIKRLYLKVETVSVA